MDAITRAQKHIDTLEPAVSGSGGHAATFRACRILVNDYNLSLDEAWPILLTFNARCEPPWNEKELRRKLEDAARRPKGNYGTDKSQGRKKPEPDALPPSKRIAKGQAKYNPPPKAPTEPPPVPQLDSSVIATLAEKGAPVLSRYFLANISATDPAIVTPDMYLRALFDTARGEKNNHFCRPENARSVPLARPSQTHSHGRAGRYYLPGAARGRILPYQGREKKPPLFRMRPHLASCFAGIRPNGRREAMAPGTHYSSSPHCLHHLLRVPISACTLPPGSGHTRRMARVCGPDKARLSPHWRGHPGPHKSSCHAAVPGCYRTVNGQEKLQELLYFNPRPTLRPLLYATPLRNVEQDWTTRAAEIVARPDEWPLPLIQQAAAACTTYGLNAALQSLTPLLPPKK